MKDDDILNNFLDNLGSEEDKPQDFDIICDISPDFKRTSFISRDRNIKKLTTEQRAEALLIAQEQLEKTRTAFLDFQKQLRELQTTIILDPVIRPFAEYAYNMVDFIGVIDAVTEDRFEMSPLADYATFEGARACVEAFLMNCHNKYGKKE